MCLCGHHLSSVYMLPSDYKGLDDMISCMINAGVNRQIWAENWKPRAKGSLHDYLKERVKGVLEKQRKDEAMSRILSELEKDCA